MTVRLRPMHEDEFPVYRESHESDLVVDEPYRGRGLGCAAMRFVEEEAGRRGLDRIELNVFGRNEVARSLYRSLGYEEFAVGMGKDLA